MIDLVKWSFAVGHVFNDLCGSMWFLFVLPYFTKVVKLENSIAGDILLIGQVCDAISTPLIGIESDCKGFLCESKVGKRKSWHLLGTFLTVISFPFIFIPIVNFKNTVEWYLIVYYTPFVAVFQFAWATVQVTHLSLIPIMVQEGMDNSTLNSLRYMFTVVSNVMVLVTTTLLFIFLEIPPMLNNNETKILPSSFTLNPNDQITFVYLSIGIVIVGLIFSIIFQVGVPERSVVEATPLLISEDVSMSKKDWFKEPQFYLINCFYLSTRLIVNVSQTYLILYVLDTLGLAKIYGSTAVLATFISGAIASIIIKGIQKNIGKKICCLTGLVFISAYCIMVAFSYFHLPVWRMYLSMVILGIGSSMLMIGSLSLTADLIGKSCSSSAFVYGCMSFSDKLSCGIVIWILQRFGPLNKNGKDCQHFYLKIQLYFIGSCVVFALIILLIIFPRKIGIRKKDQIIKSNDYDTDNEIN